MITVLVEGPGDKQAIPILVQRELGKPLVRPISMKGKSNIVRRERGFEDTVRRQYALGRRSFIVLVDGDVTYPPYQSLEEEQSDMPRRAGLLARELGVEVKVCWSVLEMESWLIGGIKSKSTYCGLRRVGRIPPNTETAPRDPKQWLKDHLQGEYKPRTQACLAHQINLQRAKGRNSSLQIFFETTKKFNEHSSK
jgi:hypothetical protein